MLVCCSSADINQQVCLGYGRLSLPSFCMLYRHKSGRMTPYWSLLDTTMQAPLSFFSATDNGVTLNHYMTLIILALPIVLMSSAEASLHCHHWANRHGVSVHGDDNTGHTDRALFLAKSLS